MIARMNALIDLTTEVRFRERMRGYDFEEVDSYVKTVSRAAAQAAEQISELQQRLAQTESHSGNAEGVPETREMLLRTLVLAQRTADAAVSEARSEAKSITGFAQERAAKTVAEAEAAANERLRSSEERAVQTLAEAEGNCQLILAEAKRTAAAELATERARKIAEIQALEATTAELEAATAAIGARLDKERSQLRSLSVSFQSFVEQFEPVADPVEPGEETAWAYDSVQEDADAEAPEAGAGEPAAEPQALADADSPGESVLEFPPDPGDRSQASAEDHDGISQASAEDHDGISQASAEDHDGISQAAAEDHDGISQAAEDALADTLAADAMAAGTVPDLPAVGWHDEPEDVANGSSGDADTTSLPESAWNRGGLEPGFRGSGPVHREPADLHPSNESETVAAPTMHAGHADGPELFDVEAEDDDEFIEQLRRVVRSDAPLPNTDAAMAAFFDHDEGAGRGGRLGQRA